MPETNYPFPVGTAGEPFADPNFKLVVLDALLRREIITLGSPSDLARFVLGRDVDLEEELDHVEHEIFPAIHTYLARYPITASQIASVTELAFDGGNEIYQLAWYLWDGESSEFDTQSIAGIEQCVNLKKFAECSMLQHCDLSLLTALPRLQSIMLTGGARYQNPDALLHMPALRTLTLYTTTFGESGSAMLKTLADRGVVIKLY